MVGPKQSAVLVRTFKLTGPDGFLTPVYLTLKGSLTSFNNFVFNHLSK